MKGRTVDGYPKRQTKGVKLCGAGEKYHMDPRTAKRYAESPQKPEYTLTEPKPTKLDVYKQQIDHRLEEAPYSAVRILEKLKEQGFEGEYGIVKEYVRGEKMDLNEKATVRFETMPGKQGQMDRGFFEDQDEAYRICNGYEHKYNDPVPSKCVSILWRVSGGDFIRQHGVVDKVATSAQKCDIIEEKRWGGGDAVKATHDNDRSLMPKEHFLRKLEAALDLSFVYEETETLYSRKYGRPLLIRW